MFKLNSYKMVYVFKSEDYMYRRTALLRAHQVFTAFSCYHHYLHISGFQIPFVLHSFGVFKV